MLIKRASRIFRDNLHNLNLTKYDKCILARDYFGATTADSQFFIFTLFLSPMSVCWEVCHGLFILCIGIYAAHRPFWGVFTASCVTFFLASSSGQRTFSFFASQSLHNRKI
jgi:hypothetical protein